MSDTRDPQRDQPLPTPGKQNVQQALIAALGERMEYGVRKYGTPLQTHNGRDALVDAWEEALDLLTYLTQMRLERGDTIGPVLPAGEFEPTCSAGLMPDNGDPVERCILNPVGHPDDYHLTVTGKRWYPAPSGWIPDQYDPLNPPAHLDARLADLTEGA
jgi:hypothetical protein